MQENDPIKKQRKIEFLYTNIGRGHPYYLDGIKEALVRMGGVGVIRGESDVFESSNFISRLPWDLARWLYQNGATDNLIGRIYSKIRSDNDYNKRSLLLSVMGRSIKKRYKSNTSQLVVAHPSLAAILRDRVSTIYQHGETIAPVESLVQGIDTVIVPTLEVAELFDELKNKPLNTFISGLCIEPALVNQAEEAFYARLVRLEQELSLTGAIYSSGAEPIAHVDLLAKSAIALAQNSHQAIVFAMRGGRLHTAIENLSKANQIQSKVIDTTSYDRADRIPIHLVLFDNRREEYRLTARFFSLFDLAIFPAHERSNWSLGLGLPTLVVGPNYGPFAPMNHQNLINSGVAIAINDESDLNSLFSSLNSKKSRKQLTKMSDSGWGKEKIEGFKKIANFLVDRVDQS